MCVDLCDFFPGSFIKISFSLYLCFVDSFLRSCRRRLFQNSYIFILVADAAYIIKAKTLKLKQYIKPTIYGSFELFNWY